MKLLDVNVLLRHLLGDEPKQSAAATRFFRAHPQPGSLFVLETALAEAVWILQNMGWQRQTISEKLSEVLNDGRFHFRDEEVLKAALRLYAEQKVSFIDAFQAAYASEHGLEGVVSFDRDFEKLGVKRIEPGV